MASRKEEEPEEFKVVDRRLFNSEGERRNDIEETPEPPPKPVPEAPRPQPATPQPPAPVAVALRPPEPVRVAPAAAPAASPAETVGEEAATAETGLPQGPVQFEHLVMSLISSAMYQLGMAAAPGQPPPRPDLPAAQETIDLLAVLRVKTKGNLTPEEEHLLTGGLQELQLAFVEISRRAGRIQ